MDKFLTPLLMVILTVAGWAVNLVTPIFANVDAPGLLVPIIVAILSGGAITAIVNLFLFRSNRDSIISQAAENAVTAQRDAYKDTIEQLRDRIKDLENENRRLKREAAELRDRLEAHERRMVAIEATATHAAALAESRHDEDHPLSS
jgi:predicted RNase H-like nuclease (RuvC/YqgF family)